VLSWEKLIITLLRVTLRIGGERVWGRKQEKKVQHTRTQKTHKARWSSQLEVENEEKGTTTTSRVEDYSHHSSKPFFQNPFSSTKNGKCEWKRRRFQRNTIISFINIIRNQWFHVCTWWGSWKSFTCWVNGSFSTC